MHALATVQALVVRARATAQCRADAETRRCAARPNSRYSKRHAHSANRSLVDGCGWKCRPPATLGDSSNAARLKGMFDITANDATLLSSRRLTVPA